MKLKYLILKKKYITPAAFRRLCVETTRLKDLENKRKAPAAFRRLCVETTYTAGMSGSGGPAAFRRLCVETSTQ